MLEHPFGVTNCPCTWGFPPPFAFKHGTNLYVLLSVVLFLLVYNGFAQRSNVKVGLTLSGGGAKGLAHIGILKAIDSAELKIDYITGTSMGSIVGGLYAVGYSGNQIEKIAKSIDWTSIFNSRSVLRDIGIDEKSEFDAYSLELPVDRKKGIQIKTGFIEGQELWLKFGELFLPVYGIKDFSKFSIPFKCVATDVGTSDIVLLDSGEVATAIRASMAIPSIFTAIDYKDTKLVDGGVVKNFPVSVNKEMGANFLIGVNLSQGLRRASELNTALDILYQIGFYKDASTMQADRKLCDILVEPNVKKYSAANFQSSDSIISIGNQEGAKYFPIFKKLADSLKALDPTYSFIENRLPSQHSVVIDEIDVHGLKNTTSTFVKGKMDMKLGNSYQGKDFTKAIRKTFASGLYNRISYTLLPSSPGHAVAKLDVSENSIRTLKVAMHYNTYGKIAVIAGFNNKNKLFDRSRTLLKLNISENGRALLEHKQNVGKRENKNLIISAYHERFDLPLYNTNFKLEQIYRSFYSSFDLRLQHLLSTSTMLGLSNSLNFLGLRPKLSPGTSYNGTNRYYETRAYFMHNSLNQKAFPTKGWLIDASGSAMFNQKLKSDVFKDGVFTQKIDSAIGRYGRVTLKVANYFPIRRFTWITQIQGGITFDQGNAVLNFYSVGGLVDFIRNQATFSGLSENQVSTYSFLVNQLGLQYQATKDVFLTARANTGVYNFFNKSFNRLDKSNFLSGYSLSGGYNTVAGPFEISLMYSDQAKDFTGYVNLGFHF